MILILSGSCTEDQLADVVLQLEKVEHYGNDRLYMSTDLIYDDQGTLTTIHRTVEADNQVIMNILRDGDQVIQIRNEILRSNQRVNIIYEVEYQLNEIILRQMSSSVILVFRHTEGYIDEFEIRYANTPSYKSVLQMERDLNDNIQRISHYETNPDTTDLLVYQYDYDGHQGVDLPDAFNPVYQETIFWDQMIPHALGLRLSNTPPMSSSYLDATGLDKDDLYRAKVESTTVTGNVERLSYSISDYPDNEYRIDLLYLEI